ncbi:PREDICTED: ankyrin [Prunus dulcis]|uniref:PREDICTED: ankyrin n=1 Tax=Prunus dulcis TaxID=3755 RepID=A0A5E4GBD7_PRUDU|nr:hypothetical protein L3X38_000373 [Prunus dulcis]VVA37001.1 PREDICTED: ankyrin [Prunus dulcis]
MMEPIDLTLQDGRGNTAFCLAAAAGSVDIAKLMIRKYARLPEQVGAGGKTPFYFAALFGHEKMAMYLYSQSPYSQLRRLEENPPWEFFTCINTGLYGLALIMLKKHPGLALARDQNRRTALHLLAQKPSAFEGGHNRTPQQIFMRLIRYGNPAHALLKELLNKVADREREEFNELIRTPSHLLFDAVESGNSKFVAQLLHDCPGLIWETDGNKWTIIHAAVKYRNASIYSLVHEIGMIKDVIVTFGDKEGNTMLHLAANLAPAAQLNKLSGAAFQMQRELLWFKEVKRIMQPSDIDMKNGERKTPQDVFSDTHSTLLKDGEKWMNETARSCTIVSTLIAGALFAAGISVSFGGNNYKDGGTSDDRMRKDSFRIFIISDAIAFFLSLTATLMFFSILTSRYAERDFLYSLPLKLMTGLILLLFSIIAMMVAFSSAFFIVYGPKDFLPYLVTGCAVVPVVLYTVLLFPLLKDVIASILSSNYLFKQTERVL